MSIDLVKHHVKAGLRIITDKQYRLKMYASFGGYNKLPDEDFIPKAYYAFTGRTIDLSNPITFNEKLQWLKLYDRKPIYTIMSDKYLAKKFVSERIGEEYVVPTYGVWTTPEEIDFDKLPDKFVLKCNHNSGLGMCICKDKSQLNIEEVKVGLQRGLDQDYYRPRREWTYKNIPRRIIAEKYMEDKNAINTRGLLKSEGLIDYKFYCFNGTPQFLYVGFANMINGAKHDVLSFLTLDWKKAPFYREDHEQIPVIPPKPKCLDTMIGLAAKLSEGIPFVRVDFFVINEHPYFSEFTFVPGGGYGVFHPEIWEKKLGDLIILPEKEIINE